MLDALASLSVPRSAIVLHESCGWSGCSLEAFTRGLHTVDFLGARSFPGTICGRATKQHHVGAAGEVPRGAATNQLYYLLVSKAKTPVFGPRECVCGEGEWLVAS